MNYPVSPHKIVSVAEIEEMRAESKHAKETLIEMTASYFAEKDKVEKCGDMLAEANILIEDKAAENDQLKATIARLESTVKGLQKFADEDAARIAELEALVEELTAALESAGELEARF